MSRLFLRKINPKSQIAVIITLVIAVIILFTFVFINLAKVSNIKLLTANVADRGALGLCSALGTNSNKIIEQFNKKAGCDFNWGIILPVVGIVAGLIIMLIPVAGGLIPSALILSASFGMLNVEISNFMKSTFADAAAAMTQHTGFRESAIEGMLQSVASDPVKVTRVAGTTTFKDPDGRVFDLTGSIALGTVKEETKIPRFYAWYWSKRYPRVSDQALVPAVKQFIEKLFDVTFLDYWNSTTWQVEELSLKVHNIAVTNSAPTWVIGGDAVRAVGPVSKDGDLSDQIVLLKLLFGGRKGFLPEKFISLTERLLDAGYDNIIKYSKKTWWPFPWPSFLKYDHTEITDVVEDIRGFLVRTIELLNYPVSERIPRLLNWLPLYSKDGAGETGDIKGRFTRDVVKINEWIAQLEQLDTDVLIPTIPPHHGTYCCVGTGAQQSQCETDICCDDDGCWCCAPMEYCGWNGPYCECSPSNACRNGDLFGASAGCTSNHCGMCTCSCPENYAAYGSKQEKACRFQGQLTVYNSSGDTEVKQAIRILQETVNLVNDKIIPAIDELKAKTAAVLAPTPAKNEAVYGWNNKNWNDLNNPSFLDSYHVVRVRIDNYLPPEKLPYISEEMLWPGVFIKCRKLNGDTTGNMDFTVSRYDTDLPTAWWRMRYRKQPQAQELYETAAMQAMVNDVLNSGIVTSDTNASMKKLLDEYAITSQTKGFYGPSKNQIRLEKLK